MVSIPACHAGDRGSIPRRGDEIFKTIFLYSLLVGLHLILFRWKKRVQKLC